MVTYNTKMIVNELEKEIQEKIRRIESGTTQRVVKLGTIMELQIEVPDKETQRRVVEMDTLCRKKERMYLKLMEQERQLTEIAIRKIMGDDDEKRY